MIRIFYTALLVLVSPFFLYGLFKKKPGKPSVSQRWKEHFGATPRLDDSSIQPLWIHAVSVGEVIAISPLIKRLKEKQPSIKIVLTTTTPTGAAQASKLKDLVEHRYMPLDFGFAVKGFLQAIKPSQLLIVETELWPNTLHWVAKANIPISVVNARLSERSCQRYAKVQPIFNLLSKNLSLVLCQHEDDAERFIRLGVDSQKVAVTGSLKFDISVDDKDIEAGKKLRDEIGQRPVWIAASTHEGEDEQLLDAHQSLLEQIPDALMIIVPRHPERFTKVFEIIKQRGLTTIRRTSKEPITSITQVFLADTMGEMMTLLAASDVCFMGGSLLGDKVGGHNLLEPSIMGLPTLTGPSYFNFKDITQQLLSIDACQVTVNDEAITQRLWELLSNEAIRNSAGEKAQQYVQKNAGAIATTLQFIEKRISPTM
ncbi:lipid IV(A) 3-deoxy-D-manno-octulosonic acid transferase [Vibrio sp. ZSDZ34]|uniref:3-deoxy-D-manno-octulosonic acid transferase n=1 Tax=Vibrio gelatinilyticus TaxID=2893468 RepID=A0A9X2AX28_9VIBR|nr:lipid IV(A) 3-deoxy-D-manno-octulosonic acid transferase [Vibrio gelatinilyticus]MCJ2378609.1 lipid IV(A) 3-deoxy-D-manno-octulosonic acid transferase [Vibrio gelatinilyticus]